MCLAASIIVFLMTASQVAAVLGRRGGRARARRLSRGEKRRIAALGGQARKRSLEAARRIVDNLRYAEAVDALRGAARRVRRVKTCEGPLPGIYSPTR